MKIAQVHELAHAQKGDIGLEWGTNWIARLIESGESLGDKDKHPPSHAFLMFAEDVIFEARYPRVALTHSSEYAESTIELYRIVDAPELTISKALDLVVRRYLGHMYGFSAVWAMAVIEPARAAGIFLPNLLADLDNVFCSELAAIYLNEFIPPPAPPEPRRILRPAEVDPDNLRKWLRARLV